ncbi:glutamyl-tRNA reductase [Algoriphagus sediminis]|uniref:Glutamyl-tRNA reductase n=1 Tax=Algoriphagus sediminis TaxID=3057113 RepID=A0ABT7Y872_9BACT|nr:glutamyl-tRNA reductase [Algoriphagus sediminis]MDN3202719.1 glutamyl-tRNA reductase [Algoriphagus sediminis]
MQQKFRALSLSHKTAPVKIREVIALDERAIHDILLKLKEFFSLGDALILSTCNRTEVYYSHELDLSTEIIKLVGLEKGIPDILNYSEYFEIYAEDKAAIEHLFRVSMGLEAQVIGDIQISNQVKRAYQASADLDMAGPFLHRLMHTIFFSNKRIVQETSFRDGAASLSYAAIELIESITSNTFQPRVLIIGVGEIGRDVVKNMIYLPDAKVKITNRTRSKAEEIAAEHGFEVVDFEDCEDAIAESDVIVSSIQRKEPFITKALIQNLRIQSYKLFIDLSVPRSVETSIEEIPGVVLYNVDNIKSKASEALDRRIAAIPDVEQIISDAIEEFHTWKKEMLVSPTINKLKESLEKIRQEELQRHLKKAGEKEVELVDRVTKSMMQKILKIPVVQLKAACQKDQAEQMIDLISDIFNLDKGKITK